MRLLFTVLTPALTAGVFFKKHPYKDKTTKSKYEKIRYI